MNKSSSLPFELEYRPGLPADKSRGIAVVGAGEIVTACHLPAYRMAGFRVVGIFDLNVEKAQAAADEFGIPRVFGSLEELLGESDVQIVDIAVPAKFQPEVVERVAAAGKHMLCQKPLGETWEDALRITCAVRIAGVKAAVNQQMRWTPGIRASRCLVHSGLIGTPIQASIQVNVHTAWENWPWLTTISTLEFMYHSIHYMDSIRSVMGQTPEFVYADAARFPGQPYRGETRTLVHMKFAGDARGLIHDNHNNFTSMEDWYATFRFEGTDGVIKGTNGALYNYPIGREDTIRFYSRKLQPAVWFEPLLEGRWFPHAFMGTMGELQLALEEDREPENSVEDNLDTIRMVLASYRSAAENRPVYLNEFES